MDVRRILNKIEEAGEPTEVHYLPKGTVVRGSTIHRYLRCFLRCWRERYVISEWVDLVRWKSQDCFVLWDQNFLR